MTLLICGCVCSLVLGLAIGYIIGNWISDEVWYQASKRRTQIDYADTKLAVVDMWDENVEVIYHDEK